MFESRNRLVWPAVAAVLVSIVLGGCSASTDGSPFPPPASDEFKARFSTATPPALPFPTDLFFQGSTDGTLNLPVTAQGTAALPWHPLTPFLNALDGWSTTAPITTSFTLPLDAASLEGSVHVVELYLSNTTKAPAQAGELPTGVLSPVRRVLVEGEDFSVGVSPAIDSEGKILQITPLKPLTPSTGAINIGYLVIVTDGVTSTTGAAATADTQYASYLDAPADCSNFNPASDALNYGLCALTKGHLAIGQAVGVDPASVVLAFSFTTQSIEDTLNVLNTINAAQPLTVTSTGLNTAAVGAAGKANIFAGKTTVPYFLTPAANATDAASVLTRFWVAAGPPAVPTLDQTSRHLTRFNPVPAKKADVEIPVLVTVPNATAAGGNCTKPAAGWPVAIVQHGITGNRTQAVAMADSFADACVVVAAIDLPLHGLVPDQDGTAPDTTSPLYCSSTTANPICMGAIERTFNVDLVNNSTGATGADQKVDSSGAHFINIPSPLTSRDNLRQGASDLNVFAKSVRNMDLTGDGVSDIDPNRVHLVGLSLGAMVATVAADHTPILRTVSASAPGGVTSRLLLDSAAFGPRIRNALGASLVIDSNIYELFVGDLQAVIDAGDAINHIAGAVAQHPYHLMKVVDDQVVPNNATDRLIVAGGLDKLTAVGPNPVSAGDGGYTVFTAGDHGTLFSPAASLPATVEMQRQTVTFVATTPQPGGPFVVITDVSVLDLD